VLTDKSDDIALKKEVLAGKQPDLTELDNNLWLLEPRMMAESVNWVPFHSLFKQLNRVNSRKYARCIQSAIDRLEFKEYIILNDSLMFRGYDLKELLEPASYVYYIRDYLVSQPYFRKHGLQMEPELMAKSDVVTANSVFLKNYAAKYNPNSHYIGQGYENTFFDATIDQATPEALKQLKPKPIIGYVGTLTHLRLDENLLIEIANRLDEHQLVFVGPEDEVFTKSKLHSLPNVHFLGLKKMNELAAFVQHFDVCINPQLVNDLTIGNYPLKIDEYLSMGKPTVATKTEAMEAFAVHTYLAANAGEFIAFIEQAIQEDNKELREQRIAFAKEHSWENSINALYKAISS
jgi:glycosyltransferase involved in cell wall biosynthesis